MEKISVFYFSGTGGTEMAAIKLTEALRKQGAEVELLPLSVPLYSISRSGSSDETEKPSREKRNPEKLKKASETAETLILLYPVYALDAPWPVYGWIETLEGNGRPMGVISVSGGGEVSSNRKSREFCCRTLEEKGFKIIYEKMLVMPPNFITPAKGDLAVRLLHALPRKAEETAREFLTSAFSGTSRIRGELPNPFYRLMSACEKRGGKRFSRHFRVNDECNSCGWCVRNCPTGNITLIPGSEKPVFGKLCALCLRCIYGCPAEAIKTWIPFVIKEGFNLEALEKKYGNRKPAPLKECGKGILWKGVVDYLKK